jgi:hypothetical protein
MKAEAIAMVHPDDDVLDDEPGSTPVGVPASGDDFFCIRYRVWYPSFDCAIRTQFHTAEGCLRCDQGRFNLKRHAAAVRGIRWRLTAGD